MSAHITEQNGNLAILRLFHIEIVTAHFSGRNETARPVDPILKRHRFHVRKKGLLNKPCPADVGLYPSGVLFQLFVGAYQVECFLLVVVLDAAHNHKKNIDQKEQQDRRQTDQDQQEVLVGNNRIDHTRTRKNKHDSQRISGCGVE